MSTDDVGRRLPTALGVRFVVRGQPRTQQGDVEVVCRLFPSGKMRIITAYRPED